MGYTNIPFCKGGIPTIFCQFKFQICFNDIYQYCNKCCRLHHAGEYFRAGDNDSMCPSFSEPKSTSLIRLERTTYQPETIQCVRAPSRFLTKMRAESGLACCDVHFQAQCVVQNDVTTWPLGKDTRWSQSNRGRWNIELLLEKHCNLPNRKQQDR